MNCAIVIKYRYELPMSADPIPAAMTATELAALLGLSRSSVSRLAADGILPRASHNRYPVRDSVARYAAYLRSPESKAGRKPDAPTDPLKAERLRLTRAQAEKEELAVARARAEMVPAAEVAREWQGIVTDLRAEILAAPARVASKLGLSRAAAGALDAELRAALAEVAEDRHGAA